MGHRPHPRHDDPPSDSRALRARIADLERENEELRRAQLELAASREQLARSERELNRAQHMARIGSWAWNVETDEVTWSDEMYLLHGIDKADFSGLSSDVVETVVHPQDREMARAANAAVRGGAMPQPLEYRVVWPDGSVHVICSEAGEFGSDEHGNTWVLRGTAQDITARRRAEEAQRDRERWLYESQRVARLGHYVYDIVNDYLSGSQTLNDVLGVEAGVVTRYAEWLAVVHPADRERVSRYFAREVLLGGAPFDLEYRIIRPCDGAERWVRGLGNLEYEEGGRPIAMFGTVQDITERKLTEDELARERSLLVQAESIGHIGSWRIGLHGRERRWSDEALHILGAAQPDAGDGFEGVRRAVQPEYREVFEDWLRAASTSTMPQRADFTIVRPDGQVRWVCAHGAREVDGEDGGTFVAGILHDVTEAKRIEEERVGLLEEAANEDALTGLQNVRGFELIAEQVVASAQRAGQGLGLIFCDVDGLKSINDEYGHAQGDRVLQDVAHTLSYTLRSADAIARIGGDEFVILAVGSERGAIERLNQRLKEGFALLNATTVRPYKISISSGVAWSEPGASPDLEELKVAADKAMYEDKLRHNQTDR